MNKQSLFVISAVVILWIVWGSNAWATKIAIATIPPLMMTGICFLIAGVVFLGWIMLLGGQGARPWAEQYLPSGITSLLFVDARFYTI